MIKNNRYSLCRVMRLFLMFLFDLILYPPTYILYEHSLIYYLKMEGNFPWSTFTAFYFVSFQFLYFLALI